MAGDTVASLNEALFALVFVITMPLSLCHHQVNEELSAWVGAALGLRVGRDFALAVVGLRLQSEHDDDCCVTVEVLSPEPPDPTVGGGGGGPTAAATRERIREAFASGVMGRGVSKGAKPDALRFGVVPRNFKGAVLIRDLTQAWKAAAGRDDSTEPDSKKARTE